MSSPETRARKCEQCGEMRQLMFGEICQYCLSPDEKRQVVDAGYDLFDLDRIEEIFETAEGSVGEILDDLGNDDA